MKFFMFIKKWSFQITSLIYSILFAWSVCILGMLFLSSDNIYSFFASSSPKTKIIQINSVKKVYTLTLSNGQKIVVIPGASNFTRGDQFEKIKNSFKFLVNGKNIINRKIVLENCFGPISSTAIWCILSAMILFQILYYREYRETPILSFAPLGKNRHPRKAATTFDNQPLTPEQYAIDQKIQDVVFKLKEIFALMIIPLFLIIYTIFYFLLDKWI